MNNNVRYFQTFLISIVVAEIIRTGDQLREKFRTWLSHPDPSINHNTACDIQHEGTAMWFIQGNTFNDWRENSSLLWISGNRTFSPCQPLCDW